MIIHDGTHEIFNYREIRNMGLSEEYFFSLPYECQKAILMAGMDAAYNRKENRENSQKRRALKQYEFEEKIKEKVLTLFKKK